MKYVWIYNSSEDFIKEEGGPIIAYGADVSIIDQQIVEYSYSKINEDYTVEEYGGVSCG